ncbi:hypothetical protein PMAYCL1PPCAC_01542, partial [Pristionchus mayeri]
NDINWPTSINWHVLITEDEHRLVVIIRIFLSNVPFHKQLNLDKTRFRRYKMRGVPKFEFELNGRNDLFLELMIKLLSSSIKKVSIANLRKETFHYFLPVMTRFLSKSSIFGLDFFDPILDDTTAPLVMSILSRA